MVLVSKALDDAFGTLDDVLAMMGLVRQLEGQCETVDDSDVIAYLEGLGANLCRNSQILGTW